MVDPISLFAVLFLVVSIFVGTFVVSKNGFNFDIREQAASPEKEECDARGPEWEWRSGIRQCKKKELPKKAPEAPVETCLANNGGECVVGASCASKGLTNGGGSCNKANAICCYRIIKTEKPPDEKDYSAEKLVCDLEGGTWRNNTCVSPGQPVNPPTEPVTTPKISDGQCLKPGQSCSSGKSYFDVACVTSGTSLRCGDNSQPPPVKPVEPVPPTVPTQGTSCIQKCVNAGGKSFACAAECGVNATRSQTTTPTLPTLPATPPTLPALPKAIGARCSGLSDKSCKDSLCSPSPYGYFCVAHKNLNLQNEGQVRCSGDLLQELRNGGWITTKKCGDSAGGCQVNADSYICETEKEYTAYLEETQAELEKQSKTALASCERTCTGIPQYGTIGTCVLAQKEGSISASCIRHENVVETTSLGKNANTSPWLAGIACGGLNNACCTRTTSGSFTNRDSCNTGLLCGNANKCVLDEGFEKAQAVATLIKGGAYSEPETLQSLVLLNAGATTTNQNSFLTELSSQSQSFCKNCEGGQCLYSGKDAAYKCIAKDDINSFFSEETSPTSSVTLSLNEGELGNKCSGRWFGGPCNHSWLTCNDKKVCELSQNAQTLVAEEYLGNDETASIINNSIVPKVGLTDTETARELAKLSCSEDGKFYSKYGACWQCLNTFTNDIRSAAMEYCTGGTALQKTLPAYNCHQGGGYCASVSEAQKVGVTEQPDIDDCINGYTCVSKAINNTSQAGFNRYCNENDILFGGGERVNCAPGLICHNNYCADKQTLAYTPDYANGVLATSMQNDIPVVGFLTNFIVGPVVRAFSPEYYESIAIRAEDSLASINTFYKNETELTALIPELGESNFRDQVFASIDEAAKAELIAKASERDNLNLGIIEDLTRFGIRTSHFISVYTGEPPLGRGGASGSNSFLATALRIGELNEQLAAGEITDVEYQTQRLLAEAGHAFQTAFVVADAITGAGSLGRIVLKPNTAALNITGNILLAPERFINNVGQFTRFTPTVTRVFKPVGDGLLRVGSTVFSPVTKSVKVVDNFLLNRGLSSPAKIASGTIDNLVKTSALTVEKNFDEAVELIVKEASEKSGKTISSGVAKEELTRYVLKNSKNLAPLTDDAIAAVAKKAENLTLGKAGQNMGAVSELAEDIYKAGGTKITREEAIGQAGKIVEAMEFAKKWNLNLVDKADDYLKAYGKLADDVAKRGAPLTETEVRTIFAKLDESGRITNGLLLDNSKLVTKKAVTPPANVSNAAVKNPRRTVSEWIQDTRQQIFGGEKPSIRIKLETAGETLAAPQNARLAEVLNKTDNNTGLINQATRASGDQQIVLELGKNIQEVNVGGKIRHHIIPPANAPDDLLAAIVQINRDLDYIADISGFPNIKPGQIADALSIMDANQAGRKIINVRGAGFGKKTVDDLVTYWNCVVGNKVCVRFLPTDGAVTDIITGTRRTLYENTPVLTIENSEFRLINPDGTLGKKVNTLAEMEELTENGAVIITRMDNGGWKFADGKSFPSYGLSDEADLARWHYENVKFGNHHTFDEAHLYIDTQWTVRGKPKRFNDLTNEEKLEFFRGIEPDRLDELISETRLAGTLEEIRVRGREIVKNRQSPRDFLIGSNGRPLDPDLYKRTHLELIAQQIGDPRISATAKRYLEELKTALDNTKTLKDFDNLLQSGINPAAIKDKGILTALDEIQIRQQVAEGVWQTRAKILGNDLNSLEGRIQYHKRGAPTGETPSSVIDQAVQEIEGRQMLIDSGKVGVPDPSAVKVADMEFSLAQETANIHEMFHGSAQTATPERFSAGIQAPLGGDSILSPPKPSDVFFGSTNRDVSREIIKKTNLEGKTVFLKIADDGTRISQTADEFLEELIASGKQPKIIAVATSEGYEIYRPIYGTNGKITGKNILYEGVDKKLWEKQFMQLDSDGFRLITPAGEKLNPEDLVMISHRVEQFDPTINPFAQTIDLLSEKDAIDTATQSINRYRGYAAQQEGEGAFDFLLQKGYTPEQAEAILRADPIYGIRNVDEGITIGSIYNAPKSYNSLGEAIDDLKTLTPDRPTTLRRTIGTERYEFSFNPATGLWDEPVALGADNVVNRIFQKNLDDSLAEIRVKGEIERLQISERQLSENIYQQARSQLPTGRLRDQLDEAYENLLRERGRTQQLQTRSYSTGLTTGQDAYYTAVADYHRRLSNFVEDLRKIKGIEIDEIVQKLGLTTDLPTREAFVQDFLTNNRLSASFTDPITPESHLHNFIKSYNKDNISQFYHGAGQEIGKIAPFNLSAGSPLTGKAGLITRLSQNTAKFTKTISAFIRNIPKGVGGLIANLRPSTKTPQSISERIIAEPENLNFLRQGIASYLPFTASGRAFRIVENVYQKAKQGDLAPHDYAELSAAVNALGWEGEIIGDIQAVNRNHQANAQKLETVINAAIAKTIKDAPDLKKTGPQGLARIIPRSLTPEELLNSQKALIFHFGVDINTGKFTLGQAVRDIFTETNRRVLIKTMKELGNGKIDVPDTVKTVLALKLESQTEKNILEGVTHLAIKTAGVRDPFWRTYHKIAPVRWILGFVNATPNPLNGKGFWNVVKWAWTRTSFPPLVWYDTFRFIAQGGWKTVVPKSVQPKISAWTLNQQEKILGPGRTKEIGKFIGEKVVPQAKNIIAWFKSRPERTNALIITNPDDPILHDLRGIYNPDGERDSFQAFASLFPFTNSGQVFIAVKAAYLEAKTGTLTPAKLAEFEKNLEPLIGGKNKAYEKIVATIRDTATKKFEESATPVLKEAPTDEAPSGTLTIEGTPAVTEFAGLGITSPSEAESKVEIVPYQDLPSFEIAEAFLGREVGLESEESFGSSANVYLSRVPVNGEIKDVAVRLMKPETIRTLVDEGNSVEDFLEEEIFGAQVFSQLGIGPKLYGRVTTNTGRVGYITEIVNGGNKLDVPASWITEQTADDLLEAHKRLLAAGFYVSGDLQYLVTPEGRAVLVDAATVRTVNELTETGLYTDEYLESLPKEEALDLEFYSRLSKEYELKLLEIEAGYLKHVATTPLASRMSFENFEFAERQVFEEEFKKQFEVAIDATGTRNLSVRQLTEAKPKKVNPRDLTPEKLRGLTAPEIEKIVAEVKALPEDTLVDELVEIAKRDQLNPQTPLVTAAYVLIADRLGYAISGPTDADYIKYPNPIRNAIQAKAIATANKARPIYEATITTQLEEPAQSELTQEEFIARLELVDAGAITETELKKLIDEWNSSIFGKVEPFTYDSELSANNNYFLFRNHLKGESEITDDNTPPPSELAPSEVFEEIAAKAELAKRQNARRRSSLWKFGAGTGAALLTIFTLWVNALGFQPPAQVFQEPAPIVFQIEAPVTQFEAPEFEAPVVIEQAPLEAPQIELGNGQRAVSLATESIEESGGVDWRVWFPANYVPQNLVDISENVELSNLVKLSGDVENHLIRKETLPYLLKLAQAVKERGFTLYILDTYRSYEYQKAMFGNNSEGVIVANPGTSPHQTGFALDMILVDQNGKLVDFSQELIALAEGHGFLHTNPLDTPHFLVTEALYEGATDEIKRNAVLNSGSLTYATNEVLARLAELENQTGLESEQLVELNTAAAPKVASVSLNTLSIFDGVASVRSVAPDGRNNWNQEEWLPIDTASLPEFSNLSAPRRLSALINYLNIENPNNLRYAMDGNDTTFCNIFVGDVTAALGVPIPRWIDGQKTNANFIYDWLSDASQGGALGWEAVSAREAQELADQGLPVVGAIQRTGRPGHVFMVIPGSGATIDGVFYPTIANVGIANFVGDDASRVRLNENEEISYYVNTSDGYKFTTPSGLAYQPAFALLNPAMAGVVIAPLTATKVVRYATSLTQNWNSFFNRLHKAAVNVDNWLWGKIIPKTPQKPDITLPKVPPGSIEKIEYGKGEVVFTPTTRAFVKKITDLEVDDPALTDKLFLDRSIIRTKYGLPSLESRRDDPAEHQRRLEQIASTNGIAIRPWEERRIFFETHPSGAVYDEKENAIFIVPKSNQYNYVSTFEHELIHGLQNTLDPDMSIEVMEYEAYVSANMGTPNKTVMDSLKTRGAFFFSVLYSVSKWYELEGLPNPWTRTEPEIPTRAESENLVELNSGLNLRSAWESVKFVAGKIWAKVNDQNLYFKVPLFGSTPLDEYEYAHLEEIPRFTAKEASTVNRMLGLGNTGLFKNERGFPETIDLKAWWNEAGPRTLKASRNREFFIGWELKGNNLKIAETAIGTRGEVGKPDPYLVDFHTHVELSEGQKRTRKKELRDKGAEYNEAFEIIPEIGLTDISFFLSAPGTYVQIITGMPKEKGKIPVFVAIKTERTPWSKSDLPSMFRKRDRIVRIMQWDALLDRIKTSYRDILNKDLLWKENFGLVIYRGYLSENLNEAQIIEKVPTRLELFLESIKTRAGKIWGAINDQNLYAFSPAVRKLIDRNTGPEVRVRTVKKLEEELGTYTRGRETSVLKKINDVEDDPLKDPTRRWFNWGESVTKAPIFNAIRNNMKQAELIQDVSQWFYRGRFGDTITVFRSQEKSVPRPKEWTSLSTSGNYFEKSEIILEYKIPVQNIFTGALSYEPLYDVMGEDEVILNQRGLVGAQLVAIWEFKPETIGEVWGYSGWRGGSPTIKELGRYNPGQTETIKLENRYQKNTHFSRRSPAPLLMHGQPIVADIMENVWYSGIFIWQKIGKFLQSRNDQNNYFIPPIFQKFMATEETKAPSLLKSAGKPFTLFFLSTALAGLSVTLKAIDYDTFVAGSQFLTIIRNHGADLATVVLPPLIILTQEVMYPKNRKWVRRIAALVGILWSYVWTQNELSRIIFANNINSNDGFKLPWGTPYGDWGDVISFSVPLIAGGLYLAYDLSKSLVIPGLTKLIAWGKKLVFKR